MGGNLKQGFGLNAGGGGGGGTNTNIANANLDSDGNHTLDVAATTLTVDSGATEIFKVNGSTDRLVIGASGTDYSMPADRGTNQYVLQTNGSGAASWQPEIERLSWQSYNGAIESTNYFYANPMTDNKYKALADKDLGAGAISEDTTLTISQLVRGGYYVVDRTCQVRSGRGWGTSTNGEVCTIVIVKFTPVNRGATALAPTIIATGTFTGESDNNVSKSVTFSVEDVSIASGDILMPMIKTAAAEESTAVYFNVIFTLY